MAVCLIHLWINGLKWKLDFYFAALSYTYCMRAGLVINSGPQERFHCIVCSYAALYYQMNEMECKLYPFGCWINFTYPVKCAAPNSALKASQVIFILYTNENIQQSQRWLVCAFSEIKVEAAHMYTCTHTHTYLQCTNVIKIIETVTVTCWS